MLLSPMSALPHIADSSWTSRKVRKVPNAEIRHSTTGRTVLTHVLCLRCDGDQSHGEPARRQLRITCHLISSPKVRMAMKPSWDAGAGGWPDHSSIFQACRPVATCSTRDVVPAV